MKPHIVYKITIKSTNKCYIGYTNQTLQQRLHKHLLNSSLGVKTKFYNAIRKYGPENITAELLFETPDKLEALNKEMEFIKIYNTFKNGYNSNLGGSGGNIVGLFKGIKKIQYRLKLQRRSAGINNANSYKVSNEEILELAVTYFKQTQKAPQNCSSWKNFCREKNIPAYYQSKFRFNGRGITGLKEELRRILTERNIKWSEKQFERDYSCLEFRNKVSQTLKNKNYDQN